jgi:hypothetical protein
MRLKSAVVLLVALLASTSALAQSDRGHAQQPVLFEIVVPAASLDSVAGPFNDTAPLRQILGKLTVRANGAICLTAELMASTSDVVMQLGLPGQASPCTMDGSEVTLTDGHGILLSARFTLRKGSREVLINLAPLPPGTAPVPGVPSPPRDAVIPRGAPVPPPIPTIVAGCGRSGPALSGGRTSGLGTSNSFLEVTLPAEGQYFTLPAAPTGEAGLMICNVDTNASIVISAVTGLEMSRAVLNAEDNRILDQILRSAQIKASTGSFSPPSTGDGGLVHARSERLLHLRLQGRREGETGLQP